MDHKILLIDDDRALLNTLERNLAMDFELLSVEGGIEALEAVKSSGPFTIFVVDMRMPGMDGIQTIKALREIAPDAVHIMLTGNQDTATAMQAVNDGQVFRFLNKPSEISEIRSAIVDAQQYYERNVAARELVEGTFVGSIGFMSDIIELQSTHLLDTQRLTETLTQLTQELEIKLSWQERVSARVAIVGLALMSHEDRLKLQTLECFDEEHIELVAKLCQLSAKMIEHIPQLERIAKILKHFPKSDGWMSKSQHEDLVAANLLRVAFYWSIMTFRGLPAGVAIQEIKLIMPNITESLTNALHGLNDFKDERVPVEVTVDELQVGMVMYDDVANEQGAIVVSKGRRLTEPVISKLEDLDEHGDLIVKVVAGSCPQLVEECE